MPARAASSQQKSAITLWQKGVLARATRHLRKSDARMEELIDAVGPCSMTQTSRTVFEAVCRSIIYQQLAGKAAAAISNRFMGLFESSPTADRLLRLEDEVLRGAGLSFGKIRALRALAEAVRDGQVHIDGVPSMSDDDIGHHLTRIKGIGPWTVHMLLIFHLGRPDVFPAGDLGIRKAVQRLLRSDDLPAVAELEPLGVRWKPWRSVAAWYLWRSLAVSNPGTLD